MRSQKQAQHVPTCMNTCMFVCRFILPCAFCFGLCLVCTHVLSLILSLVWHEYLYLFSVFPMISICIWALCSFFLGKIYTMCFVPVITEQFLVSRPLWFFSIFDLCLGLFMLFAHCLTLFSTSFLPPVFESIYKLFKASLCLPPDRM